MTGIYHKIFLFFFVKFVYIFFLSISELVKHEENGLLFKTSTELAKQLEIIFENFPNENKRLSSFRNNLKKSFVKLRWDQCWTQNALPIFESKVC
jgi:beta-1,4-mannosyltransferase